MSHVQNVLRTAAQWTTDNPVLGEGQVGVEQFTNKFKVGNGTSHWADLRYGSQAPAEAVDAVGNSGAAFTIPDLIAGVDLVTAVLTANCTPVFPQARLGGKFTLVLTQDSTGSRTVTWPAAVKWPAGTAPTLTTTANKRDVFQFVCFDGTNWLGRVLGQNYS